MVGGGGAPSLTVDGGGFSFASRDDVGCFPVLNGMVGFLS